MKTLTVRCNLCGVHARVPVGDGGTEAALGAVSTESDWDLQAELVDVTNAASDGHGEFPHGTIRTGDDTWNE